MLRPMTEKMLLNRALLRGEAPEDCVLEPDGYVHVSDDYEVGTPEWYEADRKLRTMEGWPADEIAAHQLRLRNDMKEMKRLDRIVLDANDPDVVRVVKGFWEGIQRCNNPARIFTWGGKVVRLIKIDGITTIDYLNENSLQLESAESTLWITRKQNEEKPARPPVKIVKLALAAEHIPLPPLKRITRTPIFTKSGKLLTKPGYDAESGVYYAPDNLKIKPIPKNPTDEQVEEAKSIIADMLYNMPYETPADRGSAYAALFTPFVRDMTPGPVPGLLNSAPGPGTGKDLHAFCITYPAVGDSVVVLSPSENDEEIRKRLTSALLQNSAFIIIGNVSDISSPQYAHYMTATTWEDRHLGLNEMIIVPASAMLIFTANNPTVSTENARRFIQSRLDAKMEKPWTRDISNFKIPNLWEWVRKNRAQVIESVLILTQSWIAASAPITKCKPFGNYETWTRVHGSILAHIGIKGFLDNVLDLYEKSDIESAAIKEFIYQWWETHSDDKVQSKTLFSIAQKIDGLSLKGNTAESQARSFAYFLPKQKGRIFTFEEKKGEKVISFTLRVMDAGKYKHSSLWKLEDPNKSNREKPKETLFNNSKEAASWE